MDYTVNDAGSFYQLVSCLITHQHLGADLQGVLRNPGSERLTCEPTHSRVSCFRSLTFSAADETASRIRSICNKYGRRYSGIHVGLQNNGMLICLKNTPKGLWLNKIQGDGGKYCLFSQLWSRDVLLWNRWCN